jgi:hypothetical protein
MRRTNSGRLSLRVYGKVIEDFNFGSLGRQTISFDAPEYNEVNDQELNAPGTITGTGNSDIVNKFKTIRFGMSNSLADAGQSFVPFFDGTEVTTDNKVPLAGIGFMHFTSSDEYAGYIKPYLITLNLAAHA